MNRVVLVGRLTRDPENRIIERNNRMVTTFTLAVDRPFKNSDGEREADFIPIQLWGRKAVIASKYLSKGRMISVSGRIQIQKYQNREGKMVYYTYVVADDFQFLSPKSREESLG